MYRAFLVKAKWNDTNRVRKEFFKATNEKHAIELAEQKGALSIVEVVESFDHLPSDRQKEYAIKLNINLTSDMSKDDASSLISRKEEYDNQDPSQGLKEFASSKKLSFNKYIGKKALYNLVFRELSLIDKVAFFAFCVYRSSSEDRHENLNTHSKKEIFYKFANLHISDQKFITSMNKYSGESIRFFGNLTIDNSVYTGGSTATIAYKTAKQFLSNEKLVENNSASNNKTVSRITNANTNTNTNTKQNKLIVPPTPANNSGCASVILLVLIPTVGFLFHLL